MSSKSKAAKKAGKIAIDNSDVIIDIAQNMMKIHREMQSEGKQLRNAGNVNQEEEIAGHMEKIDEEALGEGKEAEESLEESLKNISKLVGAIGKDIKKTDSEIADLENHLQKISGNRLTEDQAETFIQVSTELFDFLHEEVQLELLAAEAIYKVTGATEKLAEAENEQVQVEKSEENVVKHLSQERKDEMVQKLSNAEHKDEDLLRNEIQELISEENMEKEELQELTSEVKRTMQEAEELHRLLDEFLSEETRAAKNNPHIADLVNKAESMENKMDNDIQNLNTVQNEITASQSNVNQAQSATP